MRAIVGVVAWVGLAISVAAAIEMGNHLVRWVDAMEAPVVSDDVIRTVVDRTDRRVAIDISQTPNDYLVCLGDDCAIPAEWDRRAADRRRAVEALGGR